jgi:zinc finger SWIM domain-containing protein 3
MILELCLKLQMSLLLVDLVDHSILATLAVTIEIFYKPKWQRELSFDQAGSMLKYFHDKIAENPSFQYALQLDCEKHITNIFWVDAKMMLDYAHFGDIVTFDTTFGTNKEYRTFGVFLGLNHFRETTIFGATLLFDETFASFEWLFRTFLAAHIGRQPRTIYTDQDAAMGKLSRLSSRNHTMDYVPST